MVQAPDLSELFGASAKDFVLYFVRRLQSLLPLLRRLLVPDRNEVVAMRHDATVVGRVEEQAEWDAQPLRTSTLC